MRKKFLNAVEVFKSRRKRLTKVLILTANKCCLATQTLYILLSKPLYEKTFYDGYL